jgi:DUF2075 family protein/predicted GIY-YIG superfamily endonuclease
MTSSEIEPVDFNKNALLAWAQSNSRNTNWPVVYTLNDQNEIYVGETTNAEMRMRQHLASPSKKHLTHVNVIFDASFNKSVCLDLESHLIKYFHADGKFTVLNGNGGITDADYFERAKYRKNFEEVFSRLVESGQLTRTIPELINSDVFKYSPFKALTSDQAIAVEDILETLFDSEISEPIVIQGDPGTGKTIIAVYLIKLLRDIARADADEALEQDSLFADFFQSGYREQAKDMRIGLVIPQKSLRETLRRVFKRTPGLSESMVIEPFELGDIDDLFDLLIVDEAHRLQQRANQPAAERNTKYKKINEKLFGQDDTKFTQLDWVIARSSRQILLLDAAQSVKPADLPEKTVSGLLERAYKSGLLLRLTSQMRVNGGQDYIDYVSKLFDGKKPEQPKTFGTYDLRFFESFVELRRTLSEKEYEVGLARLLAGYAWPWISKGKNGASHDFEIEGQKLKWNSTDRDWINSKGSVDEVGSIHTIQGYDLNYAGVIIGPELGYDSINRKVTFRREHYHDKKGKENNPTLGIKYSDADLLAYVKSIYRVLLTRGIQGTFVYVVDPELRAYLRNFF